MTVNTRGVIYSFVFLLYFLDSCTTEYFSCTYERVILTNTTGVIRNGPAERRLRSDNGEGIYKSFSRCEWLIDTQAEENARRSIMLEVTFLETECSYDYLFVYDGNSHKSPLIASLSGNTLSKTLVARSGYMLLLQFSDRNYELGGFLAKYSVEDCPYGCSGHGDCINFSCFCDSQYVGDICQYEICPDNCSEHGQCVMTGDKRHWGCKCSSGYAGLDCSVALNGDTKKGRLEWRTLMPEVKNFTNRLDHGAVYDEISDCIFVFGGYTLNSILDDLQKYCFQTNYWEYLNRSEPWPSGRHQHAMVYTEGGFYVFGGFLAGGVHSSELWYYNISLGTWTLKAENSSVQIKGLSGHTMTLAGNYMYVIGGKTDDGLYSHKMYRIDPIEPNHWEEVLVTGGRLLKRLLHGHSAVYHKETHTVLIYGGTMARSARYTELSSRIFAFNVKTHYWTEIYNAHQSHSQESFIPRQRAHHIAAIVGNYMVVYGGNVHIHQEEEKCYDEKIYFYHLGCHQWVQHPSLKLLEDSRATEYLPSKGRFAHAAITMRGNNLIVIGGYRGYVMGDMLFFKFPGVIAPPQAEQHLDRDYCMNYTENANHCINDLECLFCLQRKDISRPGCVHRTRPEMCVNKTMSTPCQGICSQLTTCHTCLNQGQGVTLTSMSRRRRVYQDDCSWCVKNSTCQKKSVPEGSCRFADGTKSGKQGWWGGLSASWTQVDQCSENDIPGGIQWMKYYTPANLSQPDEVEYLGEIKSSIKYQASSAQEVGFILSKYYGYIWPLEAEPVLGTFELKPYLRARGTYVNLSLSTDDTAKNLQLVGEVNYTTSTQVTIDTHRGDRRNRSHTQIFPNVSRKFKYFFVMEAKKRYQDDVNASLELQWNADVGKYTPTSRYIITTEFLEPYHSGNCGNYSNCLACMTDASCGWCATSNMCIVKGSNLSASCDGTNGTTFPVTSPSHCLHCPDYVDCWSCVKNELCEWRPEIEQCFRRGRFQDLAVQKVEQCAVACHRRKSCSSCVQEKDECFWCDTTMTCLPFAHYSANFIHGQCRDWIDSEGKNEYYCRDCSLKTNCETCLGTFGCGWCGDHLDRRKGKCVQGDFNGPYNENCSAVLLEHSISSNVSLSGHHNWTYGKCLDVDECKLGIGDCHPNATCYNLEGSYGCRCNQGFQGDGKNCTLTCYYDCGDHGRCSVSPNYTCICDLGWTGVDCATDCNCNYQSTCSRGVGMCDQCENNTEGPNCEHCKFGYYARNPLYGCSECHCNGHGNESSGICHNVTGQCFCTGNTTGDMCETCVPHHYGNPKNGGRCYRQCENRLELYQSSGSLGLQVNHLQNSWVIYCLWIIKIPSSLHQYLTPMVYIEVENISTKCGQDHVNIYNDVPRKLMSTTVNADDSGQVASLCGTRKTSFTVTTSIITVYFYTGNVSESGNSPPGFNISWKVLPIDGSFEPCLSGCNYSQSNHSCVCSSEVNTMAISTSVHPAQAIHSMDFKTLHEEIGRYGHSLVVSGEDTMLMFGGYSLKYGLMNDIWEYNTARMHWTKMNPMNAEEPTGRYYHAAVYVPILKEMYVYGGLISYGSPERVFASKELWKFSIGPRVWNRLDVSSEYNALAGHSMTLVGDTTLLIIGGFSSESYFNDHIYEYNTMAGGLKGWREHYPLKGAVPVGLYGHSTVYHKETETLYIYGGMEYKDYKFEVSKDLLTYDVTQRRWSHLLPEQGSKYDARMLHTAVDLGDYMVVLGGLASHNVDRNAAAQSILMYRYKCNVWHQLSLHDLQYGELLTSLVSPKAVAIKGTIYLIGGFDGQGNSRLVKVHFPEDLCVQYDGEKCLKNARCMQCLMTLPSDFDVFDMCYSADRHIPPMCHSGKVSGTPCNLQWYKEQNCSRHTSCHSCKATYPYFKYENQPCWWCEQSNKCVSVKDKELECDGADLQVFGQSSCINNPCRAADCDKCQRSDMCIWTNSNYKSDEQHIVIDKEPLYTWNCFSQSTYANPHHPHTANCKSWCFYSSTCQECLKSNGMEGGSRECVWSQTLQECMTPAYLPLRCSSGECGALLYKGPGYSENRCPLPCTQHYICAECVKEPGCGWCAFSGQNGEGVCMDGGIDGPLGTGKCSAESVKPSSGHLTLHQIRKLRQSKLPPTWDYMTCPPENECKNAHHNCDNMNQNCIDQLDGFKCTCKGGYIEQESGVCTPVCHNPCKRGRCVEPEKCECDFGWVGLQCKISCECNGNSNCLSEIRLDTCLECKNNTKGTQCQFCKPMYVGDPVQRIPCEPCFSFCNNHTETCSKCDNMNYCKEQHGPTPEFALCLNCANNTRGSRCEECRDGYFRVDKNGQKKHEACRKCQCNGHSDTCDPNTGESCQCKNNTETGCHLGSDKDSKNECWRRQCSKCKEYFMGNPVDGHHCYRQMTVDQEYCLDPTTQTNCIGAEPLLQHQTVFFGVQPRYLNVDIRITLDISEGAVDVYFSSSEKTFVVNVDSVTGGHRVSLDSELSDEVWTDADKNTHHNRKKRGLDNEMGLHRFMYDGTLNNVWSDDYNPSDSAKKRTRRSVRNSTSGQFHNLFELTANYFHTYQTIEETNTIMKIANVQSRLVLTLPLELHDLRTSKFYIILYGVGNKQSNKTYGNLYFRQDQPHIDLFVFFSVFFSSFFLFLAKCVLLWKLKQAIDAQRSRQQQQKEMAHMASRPFAKVLVLVEPEQVMYSSTPVPRRRTKLTKLSHRNPHLTLTPVETFLPPPIPNINTYNSTVSKTFCPFDIVPIATEPIGNGAASLRTIIFQLPGGNSAPCKLSLGTTLTGNSRTNMTNTKTGVRQRSNHSTC